MEQTNNAVEEQSKSFDKNVNRLTKQVKETYKRAFFDLLEEKVGASPPDYEWLTRLYGEIRSKLIALLREGSQLRVEIEESMDCDFFKQLISHNVFSPENFYALIRYVFEKCKQSTCGQRFNSHQKIRPRVHQMALNLKSFPPLAPV